MSSSSHPGWILHGGVWAPRGKKQQDASLLFNSLQKYFPFSKIVFQIEQRMVINSLGQRVKKKWVVLSVLLIYEVMRTWSIWNRVCLWEGLTRSSLALNLMGSQDDLWTPEPPLYLSRARTANMPHHNWLNICNFWQVFFPTLGLGLLFCQMRRMTASHSYYEELWKLFLQFST